MDLQSSCAGNIKTECSIENNSDYIVPYIKHEVHDEYLPDNLKNEATDTISLQIKRDDLSNENSSTYSSKYNFNLMTPPKNWSLFINGDGVYLSRINKITQGVLMSISVNVNFNVSILVLNKVVEYCHPLLENFPKALFKVKTASDVYILLTELEGINVCIGNTDKEFVKWRDGGRSPARPLFYSWISGAVHHNDCNLLTKSERCANCVILREKLKKSNERKKHFLKYGGYKRWSFDDLSRGELVEIVRKKTKMEKDLQRKIKELEDKCKELSKQDLEFSTDDDTFLKKLESYAKGVNDSNIEFNSDENSAEMSGGIFKPGDSK